MEIRATNGIAILDASLQSVGVVKAMVVGAETTLFAAPNAPQLANFLAQSTRRSSLVWRPLGPESQRWGMPNSIPSGGNTARLQPWVAAADTPIATTLLENVIDLAGPSLIMDADTALVLFSFYDPAKPGYEGTDIGLLRDDGSPLGRVSDDLRADFGPRVVPVSPDSFLASWQRVAGDASGMTNPVQIAPMLEIMAVRFDRLTGTWSQPQQLTTNQLVDRDARPIVFGGTQGILWIQNQADAFPGDADRGDRLLFSEWNGAAWQPAQPLSSAPGGILSYSFTADGAGDGHVVLAVALDGQLDIQTNRELFLISTHNGVWQMPVRLTTDAIEDAAPLLVAPNGNPMCVWKSGGVLTYSYLNAWAPRPAFSDGPTVNEVSRLEGAMIVRTNLDIELAGQVQHLTNIPQAGRTDLCLLRRSIGADAAVGSLTISPLNPIPGSNATLRATIENRGELTISNLQVSFYDGNPGAGGILIGPPQTIPGPFPGGATQDVMVSWSVPAELKPHDVYVLADPAVNIPDRDRSNNAQARRTTLPDLMIQTASSTVVSPTAVALSARVVNQGVIPSGLCSISWHLGSPAGELLGRTNVPILTVGQQYDATVLWDTTSQTFAVPFTTVWAVVDEGGVCEEFDETNNGTALVAHVVPSWIPFIVGFETLGNSNARLTFDATGAPASSFAVEATDSLAKPIHWSPAPGVTLTTNRTGRFQAQLPVQPGNRFFRVRTAP